ncbi:MAG: Fic family protein [Selenomonadaceae bacterium]|nr:Fic family protein [Selenomonadaceae bacterium]
MYENLYKLYRKDEFLYRNQYLERFNCPFSKHFSIKTREYNRRTENELFYCFSEEILYFQDKITLDTVKLLKLLQKIPLVGIKQYLNSCLVEEIKSSNDIEGVQSTKKEIRSVLKSTTEKRKNLRLGGIVNKYLKILQFEEIKLETPSDIRNLYDDFIADEIEDLPDGKIFRKGSVEVVTASQKVIHKGLYPEEKIIEYMERSLNLLHDEELPMLIRIAIFHYLFGYIHPFYDGNGRMSRFITAYYLSKYLDPTIGLRLSILIKIDKNKYYELFKITNSEINKGDLTPFIIGTLKLISIAIEHTMKILQSKHQKYNLFKNNTEFLKLSSDTKIDNLCDLLLQAAIFSDIGITSFELQSVLKKSENTISAKLKQIPQKYLIKDVSARPYHYKLNLSMFNKIK